MYSHTLPAGSKVAIFKRMTSRSYVQLPLALAPRSTWGGSRRGAGRKPAGRTLVHHRRRPDIRPSHPCHVTLRVVRGLPSLRTPSFVRAFEATLARGCDRGSFRVVHYSLQRDHAHLLVEADDAKALGRGMMSVGSRLARAFNRVFRRKGCVLADRYHVRATKTPREVRNALAYVLLNFRKHHARTEWLSHVAAGPDPASSGRWFDGWTTGSTGRSREAASNCVAEARSWLLRVGWRRHGLIGTLEQPSGSGHRR